MSQFYCANKMHQPLRIPSSRVDDTVCDCCDGTDEPDGLCANTCDEAGRAAREAAARRAEVLAAGQAKRAEFVAQAEKLMAERKTRMAELDSLMADLGAIVSQLESWFGEEDWLYKHVQAWALGSN